MRDISLREALNLIRPLPYSLVTSLDREGKPNALGVSWVTRTSFKPPLMLISIDHSRYSHEGIYVHQEFVIHFPAKDQQKGAWFCGTYSGREMDKIHKAGLSLIPSLKVKVPTIAGVTAAFECKVVSEHETGDHTVFVGEMVATRGDPEKKLHLYLGSGRQLVSLGE